MLHLKKGCTVENSTLLKEEYQRTEYGYIANIDVEKIIDVFNFFIGMQEEKLFFFLELPTNEIEENKLRTISAGAFHMDIYYIDGLTGKEAFDLMLKYGDLLVNDGLVHFGFGVQNNRDEIMSGKYNVISLQTTEPERYISLFNKLSIPRTEKITTAFDIFSSNSPGQSMRIEMNGKNIFDLPKELENLGIYFYERREE